MYSLRMIAAVAVMGLVLAVRVPAAPVVIAIAVTAVAAVVRTMAVKPVRMATPVRDFAKVSVMAVFFVHAMVLVLIVIMAIGARRRRITRHVRVTLVMSMVAVGRFAAVAVRQCGVAEGKAGNA